MCLWRGGKKNLDVQLTYQQLLVVEYVGNLWNKGYMFITRIWANQPIS